MVENGRMEAPGASLAHLFSFGEDWVPLRGFFDVAARIPVAPDAFHRRYGTSPGDADAARFVQAIRTASEVGAALGGPAAPGPQGPSRDEHVARPDRPPDVHGRLVALAGEVATAAKALGGTLPALESLLDPTVPVAERAARVRWRLSGAAGLAGTAAAAAAAAEAVREVLAELVTQFTGALKGFHESQLVNHANEDIGALQSRGARLERQSAEARKKVARSLFKSRAEEKVRALDEEAATASEALARKRALVDDTSTFFGAANGVLPALASIDGKLRRLAKVFADAAELLTTLSRSSSSEQLGEAAWLARALGSSPAWQRWTDIESAALAFARRAPAPIVPAPAQGT